MINHIGHTSYQTKNTSEMIKFYKDIIGMTYLFNTTYQELYTKLKEVFKDNPNEAQIKKLNELKEKGDNVWITYLKLSHRQYIELFTYEDKYVTNSDTKSYCNTHYYVNNLNSIKTKLDTNKIIYIESNNTISVKDPDGNRVVLEEVAEKPTITVNYITTDIKAIKRFYENLGMKIISESADALIIEVAKNENLTFSRTDLSLSKNKNNIGYKHLCIEVDDVEVLYKLCIKNGISPDSKINRGIDKSYQFWIHDPELNDIEIMQYTKESKQSADKL